MSTLNNWGIWSQTNSTSTSPQRPKYWKARAHASRWARLREHKSDGHRAQGAIFTAVTSPFTPIPSVIGRVT